ncbi:hypothetical protein BGW42_000895 [Actinomortierella wolfii]|nr:hypothetical protein BGW42_000895 [Actinomortierella wolfii]
MASSIAAAASAATVSAAGSSSDSVDLSRSRSKTNTIATMSTASGSSSPESLHPALVSTSAFGVFPPSPSMRHQHSPLPPPNTTVAIPVPLPLSKLRTTTTATALSSSSTPTISEDVHVPSGDVFLSNPSSHSTVSLPSTTNHNTYHNSSAAKGSPTFTAASGNNSPKRPSPLGKPSSLPGAPRRPPVTPHVSFEGRYPSIITTAATVPSTPTTTGGGNEGSTGPFYPTGLKDTTSAGPSALLGSKLSPHYYRAALYGSDSSNSSSSSLFFKARSGSGNGGSGSNGSGRDASGHVVSGEEGRKGVHYDGSHFSKKSKNKRMPGSNTSITFEPQSRLAVSMTSSELDPLHYLEKKPLPAVRSRVMSDVTGSDSLFAEGGRRRGPFRRLFVMTTTTRRWWVFRDQDGWMIGPWLFLLGFLFPPLWWVGALYRAKPPKEKKPRPPMPKKQKEKEIHLAARLFGGGSGGGGGVGEGTKEDVARREESKADGAKTADENSLDGADERQTLHSTVISPPALRSKHQQQPTISESELVLEMEQLAKMETPPHGPWSVEHKATLIFQERMRRDRHERRAQLEARWRTVNLVFAYSSLVLIVAICAIVFTIL